MTPRQKLLASYTVEEILTDNQALRDLVQALMKLDE